MSMYVYGCMLQHETILQHVVLLFRFNAAIDILFVWINGVDMYGKIFPDGVLILWFV